MTNNNFLNALKAKAQALQAPILDNPPTKLASIIADHVAKAKDTEIQVFIEVVTSHNRIDVTFSSKPQTTVLEQLKAAGFWYRPSDKAWYHQDNNLNRRVLNTLFNAGLSIEIEVPAETAAPGVLPAETVQDTVTDDFKQYQAQVDALCALWSCSKSDCLLKAIDLAFRMTATQQ